MPIKGSFIQGYLQEKVLHRRTIILILHSSDCCCR